MKRYSFMLAILFAFMFIGCGGGGGSSNTPSSTEIATSSNTISGVVDDDPVADAEVYIDFGDGTLSTKAITNADGSYELKLSDEDLAKINPEIPEGADAPKDNLLLIAKKDNRVLRNALTRDVSTGQIVYVTNDTEAYAQYLESIGQFDTISLTEFNSELEKGRIKDSSDKSTFIKDIREDVKTYFYGGVKPTSNTLFSKALTHLGKDKVSLVADDSSYVSSRSVMSGGDIILPEEINVTSDDITLISKGNGRYTIGDGSDSTGTAYLKIQSGDTFKLIPLDIKARVITQLAQETITPQQGGTLGTESDSISATIPPFALNENKNITFNKIDSEGETTDGKMILDMQPSGLTFEMPITVKIKYSDFGIDDPSAVEWKYGSIEGGYENADIVSLDTTNKLIYLSISHFSNLVVKSISGQKFVPFEKNFVKFIPRRNYNFFPLYDTYGSSESVIISNKLFQGSSFSNELTKTCSDEICTNNTNGGQCVQTSRTIFWSIFYNQSGRDYSGKAELKLQTYASGDTDVLRQNFSDIETGDLIWQYNGDGVGHTVTVIKEDTDKYLKIESNYHKTSLLNNTSYNLAKNNPNEKVENNANWNYSQRFGFDKYLEESHFKTKGENATIVGDYIVLKNPNDLNINFTDNDTFTAKKNKEMYSTIDSDDNPSNYYIVDEEKNGITKDGSSFKYDPDLLPVTPLKVQYTNGVGKIKSFQDSRYEIYAEENAVLTPVNFTTEKPARVYRVRFGHNTTGEITDENGEWLTEEQIKSKFDFEAFKTSPDNPTWLDIYKDGKLYCYINSNSYNGGKGYTECANKGLSTLLSLADQEEGFVKIDSLEYTQNSKKVTLGLSTANLGIGTLTKIQSKDSNISEFKMISSATDNNWATLKTDKKVKILFSPTVIDDYYVSWGADNTNHNIPIGFWNDNNYTMNMIDATSGKPSSLEDDKIYKTEEALNGYFMTLKQGKKAEWHFALAGVHAIFVHVPFDDKTYIENATYKLMRGTTEVATLEISNASEKLNTSAFDGWYVLKKTVTGEYGFTFQGNEHIEVVATNGTVAVDAIRLQGRESIVADMLELKFPIELSDANDIDDVLLKIEISDENGNKVAEKIQKAGNFSSSFEKTFLSLGNKLKLLIMPVGNYIDNTVNNRTLNRSLSREVSTSSIATQYKPQIQYVEVSQDDTTINLPKITLQKDLTKSEVKIKVINATNGSAISDANVTVRFGLDRDDNTTAYSGTTNSNGEFSGTDVPYGQYSVILSKDGFISTSLNFTVDENTPSSTDLSMSPALASGEMRIRLSWGQSPSDLDSHLVKKTDENQDYHIYYSDENDYTTGDNLDRDDTNGEGPETVTINNININSTYTYYVHNYDGDSYGKIKDSSASVKISSGDTELTYYPPNEEGIYWRVFTIENGIVKPCTSDCMGTTETVMVRSLNRIPISRESDLFRNLPSK